MPLASLGPIKLGDFRACLLAQQSLLHAEQIKQLLDDAIMSKGLLQSRQRLGLQRCTDSKSTMRINDSEQFANNARAFASKDADTWDLGPDPQLFGPAENINHLCDVAKMSSGMIFAQLAEKYARPMSGAEPPVSAIGHRLLPHGVRKQYISPYNLDERAKRLIDPARPELPCICDPECICAPLCAAEPYRNCLCEENGLFTRVTEGMDIDDLDVPDLVRRKRQSSDRSNASMSSLDHQPEHSGDGLPVWETVFDPMFDESTVAQDITDQGREQKALVIENFDLTGFRGCATMRIDNILYNADLNDGLKYGTLLYCDQGTYALPGGTSDALHKALVRPFAEQCNTPPKPPKTRAGLTRRLFRGPNKTQLGRSRMPMSPGDVVTKKGTKRSLADVSLPSLKRTVRHSREMNKVGSPDRVR